MPYIDTKRIKRKGKKNCLIFDDDVRRERASDIFVYRCRSPLELEWLASAVGEYNSWHCMRSSRVIEAVSHFAKAALYYARSIALGICRITAQPLSGDRGKADKLRLYSRSIDKHLSSTLRNFIADDRTASTDFSNLSVVLRCSTSSFPRNCLFTTSN